MIPPDYDAKKAAASLYGWHINGYASEPRNQEETISLYRWEDANGIVIAPPPIIVRADGGQFFDTSSGQHQVFCRLPYYDSPEVWLLLLRVEELRKRRTR